MQRIDMLSLRASLDRLRRGELLMIARRAAEMLPEESLAPLLEGLVELRSGSNPPSEPTLLEDVQTFHAQAMQGGYYEAFDVNSRTCSDQSRGTDAFVAEFHRLIAQCVREADIEPGRDVALAFETLMSLLRSIDEANDDVLFFADEGGSWLVGVEWPLALPAYFRCLAQFAPAKEFALGVTRVVEDFVGHDRARYIGAVTENGKNRTLSLPVEA